MLNEGRNLIDQLQEKLFRSLVNNRLIYNTCWEDPRIDRQLLKLTEDSKVVMLTSAGCNALDYLLDKPQSIHCVDSNPVQNALLDFKKALFLNGDFDTLWNFFGRGYEDAASILYDKRIKEYLSVSSRHFWNTNINYFSSKTAEGTFYFRGTSGQLAHAIHKRIKRKNIYGSVIRLLNSKSLEEQAYYFEEVEKQLWNAFYKWLIKRDTTMAFLGVPAVQKKMIENSYQGGLLAFIQEALQQVFTGQSLKDNYFWRVYLTGSYQKTCCPNYLKREHFNFIRNNVSKISLHTSYLADFLERNPGSYTHFVLLDHQDWLANSDNDLLKKEWKLILENAEPGTKILFRSAGNSCRFLPDFVFERVRFKKEVADRLHALDRVGTYGGTFLAEVKA